jgi:hypothetical protein
MPPAEFEPTIPTSERPQTHDLDRAVSGIGDRVIRCKIHKEIIFIYIYIYIKGQVPQARCVSASWRLCKLLLIKLFSAFCHQFITACLSVRSSSCTQEKNSRIFVQLSVNYIIAQFYGKTVEPIQLWIRTKYRTLRVRMYLRITSVTLTLSRLTTYIYDVPHS